MKRHLLPYNPRLKQRARYLRNNSTLSEVLLWQRLKGRQISGYDFHRQKPLGYYIVDFFCNALMLAVEIDGSSHEVEGAYTRDQRRQRVLERMGVTFLRFEDVRVKQDMVGVLWEIEQWITDYEKRCG